MRGGPSGCATGRADAANDRTSWIPEKEGEEAENHWHAQPTELATEGGPGDERQNDNEHEHRHAHACAPESNTPAHGPNGIAIATGDVEQRMAAAGFDAGGFPRTLIDLAARRPPRSVVKGRVKAARCGTSSGRPQPGGLALCALRARVAEANAVGSPAANARVDPATR